MKLELVLFIFPIYLFSALLLIAPVFFIILGVKLFHKQGGEPFPSPAS